MCINEKCVKKFSFSLKLFVGSCTNADGNCVTTADNTIGCPDATTDCECGPTFMRDPTKDNTDATACVAVPITDPHCDPSRDRGADRTCACVDQTDPPDTAPLLTAYLDPAACFCIGGYTQDPTDERLCTGIAKTVTKLFHLYLDFLFLRFLN